MIYSQTLKSLTEDEISILFLICDKFLEPLNISPSYNYLKMLNVNVTCRIIDILEAQAKEENKILFQSLKNKINQQ